MVNEQLVTLSLPFADKGNRTVRVFVPAHEEEETLPVVYMTDGQNLFEKTPRILGSWFAHDTVRAERQQTGQAAVIVGIHNDQGPLERTNELTSLSIGPIQFPEEMPEQLRQMLRPQGEVFDDFVLHTVMPAVEERFPVKTGRSATAFCGSSSGGLQAFFTALSHPDRFCAAGVFSPVFLFYTPEDLIRWVQSRLQDSMPYLFMYAGGADELEQQLSERMELIYDRLMEVYPMERLSSVILPEQPHHESAWQAVFRDFLHTFLSRRQEW